MAFSGRIRKEVSRASLNDAAYDVYIHADLLDRMPKAEGDQAAIMMFIRALATQPHARGDFTEKDTALRPQQVKSSAATRSLTGQTMPSAK